MSIVYGVCAFKYILYGRPFVIISNSKPLAHFPKIDSPAKMITRWLMDLGEYTFTFQHLPGKFIVLADFLSCIPLHNKSTSLNEDSNVAYSNEVLPIVPNEDISHANDYINPNEYDITNITNSSNTNDPSLEISIETIRAHQQSVKIIQKVIKSTHSNNRKYNKFLICPSTNLVLNTSESNNQIC